MSSDQSLPPTTSGPLLLVAARLNPVLAACVTSSFLIVPSSIMQLRRLDLLTGIGRHGPAWLPDTTRVQTPQRCERGFNAVELLPLRSYATIRELFAWWLESKRRIQPRGYATTSAGSSKCLAPALG
jgi:hypothetical protein